MRTTTAALVLIVALGVACADSHGPDDVTGTYTLRTANGSGPPFFAYTSYGQDTRDGQPVLVEQLVEWISDTLRLNEDATYRWTSTYRSTLTAVTNFGEILETTVTTYAANRKGTFTVAGSTVEFTPDPAGERWTGTRTGDVLTVIVQSAEYVYRRGR